MRRRAELIGLGLFVAAMAVIALWATRSSTSHPASRLTAGTPLDAQAPVSTATISVGVHIRTVFLIVMENHNWSQIAGNPSAPYINRTLLPAASYASQYFNPPGVHPSLPNYLWLEAGTNCFADTGCIADDNPPGSHATGTSAHLVALLGRGGISWRAYEESISGTSCPLDSSSPFAVKHDPFMYFDDVTNGQNPHSAYCIAHERPFPQLGRDLSRHHVARYNFITPNLCDDMHDSCAPLDDPVRQGDTWLANHVPMILQSRAYRSGMLLITWDEGEGSDGPIGLIVLSPYARGHGYHNAIHYTHSSTLRTLEEIFGVRPLLGGAARARDLRDLFSAFP